jgi:hypothetical protein
MKKPNIFVSYTPGDQKWANAFAHALQEQGATVWLDTWEVMPGQPIEKALEHGLRTSDWMVFLLNPEKSFVPNLYFEVGVAVGSGKRIVPIIPQGIDQTTLPYPFKSRQGVYKESPKETARKLMDAAREGNGLEKAK